MLKFFFFFLRTNSVDMYIYIYIYIIIIYIILECMVTIILFGLIYGINNYVIFFEH